MIPVFIISMKNDLDRRQRITEQLNKYNIPFTFIDAVVGKMLDKTSIEQIDLSKVINRKKRNISLGEIGCSLSHVKVYSKIINNNIPYSLILEDDVIFDDRLAEFVNSFKYSEHLFHESDLLILGGQNGIDKSRFISRSFWSKIIVGGQLFSKTINSEKYIFRTCCYVVSFKMANNLHDIFQSEFFIADEWSYFKEIGLINDIFLSSFVDHPLDLRLSHIEQERLQSISSKSSTGSDGLMQKVLNKYSFAAMFVQGCIRVRSFLRRFSL